jgi:hypothetical protein
VSRTLSRYLIFAYAKYYVPLSVFFYFESRPLARESMAPLLLLLSMSATVAFCATLFELGSGRSFEVLQLYGVPQWDITKTLGAATICPQLVVTVLAIVASGERAIDIACAGMTLAGLICGIALAFRQVDTKRDPGVAPACICMAGAQITVALGVALLLSRAH